ncbi:protein BCL9 homolog, partial [Ceratitis capitata]|uniref:protein BCL9 homolog n=1 Tax=Ceratitis capitata TaxID=7213 RepID=UPI000C6C7594
SPKRYNFFLVDSGNSQSIGDETSNSNTGGSNIVTMDSNAKRERDGTTTSTSAMHQNSNSTVKLCPHTINASSPNNASDQSNSSNISINLSQTIESGTTDILQDLNISEKSGNKKKTNLNSLATVKEEETGVKSTVDNNGSLSGPSAKNLICKATSLNSMPSIKEETSVMVNLINVKKEDGNISPEMSPAGFSSINNLSGNSSIDVTSGTPDDATKTKMITNCNISNSNNNNEKVGSGISSINSNVPSSCTEDSLTASGSSSVIGHSSNDSGVGSTHNSAVNLINNVNDVGGSIANCMEYMQQQNHIFVFSTQLANKGAESVLSGQVPTIIAYHCTQPATINFLEDFFIKNPMKISKLHRQNTLNLYNISVGAGGQQWIGSCNTLPKISQKPIGSKLNFKGMPGALESKIPHKQSNIPNFPEVSGGNENDLMCWEQTRNNLEGASNESHPGLKTNGADAGVGGGLHISNKSHVALDTSDSCTPSLQGIKVPDENLTPQQRQHREEQLAKLKQIDQFLSNPLQGINQLGKLNTNGVPSNLASLMLNLPNSGSSSMGSQMNNPLNPSMRNHTNVMNSNNQNICNPEMPTTMCDGNIVSQDMLIGREMNNLTCNPNKSMQINNQSNMPCVSNGVVGNVAPIVSVGNITNSSLSCHSGVNNNGGNGNINGHGGLMPNSPEIVGNFVGDGNVNNNGVKVISSGGTLSQEIGQLGMAQMGWSKLQHQFFEERVKGNKGQGPNDVSCLPAALCRSSSAIMGNANMRPNMTGSCASASTTNSHSIRSAQGPPPPYHPTQRSASVPIATESPSPASPNNPTSNLSLPSPRTSGALGIPANSPINDVHVSAMSTQAVTTTSTVSTAISNGNCHSKNNFQSEGSPSSTGTSNSITMANNNNNRNRNNQMNQFNSNPSTPLSHLSPKDLESFHTTATSGDLKNARPSPQRSRTPLMGHNNGNVADATNIEGRFPSVSPGLTFPQPLNNTSNSGVNAYKGPVPIERQNSVPASSQFCRRADNLPLNPNSNRPPQNKLNHSFDPISSLAQMSQQLTSCVSLNTGAVGNTGGVGSMAAIGVNDVNVTSNVNQNIDNMMASMDTGLDHCNTGSSGMAMPPHMSGTGPFMSNNCHINSMLGPMGQRLLNPKLCAGFSPTTGSMGRDGPGGLHGVMSSHRMMGRMAMNFSNFSVPPNVQVKASTPNTIQYMPVRSQSNNNSNIRVPPSLEFLRYTNSQVTGAANIFDNSHMGQINTGPASDLGKLNNCNGPAGAGNSGMSFFSNCNHMGSMVADQEDMAGGNLTPSHEITLGSHPSMVRGMRPIRQQQHLGNQMLPGPRMQNPGVIPGNFPNGPQDPMECEDNSIYIGNSHGNGHGPAQGVAGQNQMYSGGNGQQKPVKSISSNNLCLNMNTPNATNNGPMTANSNLLPSEHNPSMLSPANGPLIMGNNINMLSNTIHVGSSISPAGCGSNTGNGPGDVGNVAYKPFVGPVSNDIKYAQQYHSFQQQLYATSTRSQQNTGNTNIGSNVSTNPTFFVNK